MITFKSHLMPHIHTGKEEKCESTNKQRQNDYFQRRLNILTSLLVQRTMMV